jgi:hypothetical protein
MARHAGIAADVLPDELDPAAIQTLKDKWPETKQGLEARVTAIKEQEGATKSQAEKAKEAADAAKLAEEKRWHDMQNAKGNIKYTSDGGIQLSPKQKQWDEQHWPALVKLMNPLTASSRGAVGVAASSNMRADRALERLNDPKVMPDEIQRLVVTDIMAIMKGGVPDAEQLRAGLLKTFGQELQTRLQHWSDNPQQYNNQAVKEQLKRIVLGLKQIDNNVINQNAGMGAASYIGLIGRHPDWWQQVQGAVSEIVPSVPASAGEQPTSHPQDSEAIQWAKTHVGDPRSTKILQANGLQ